MKDDSSDLKFTDYLLIVAAGLILFGMFIIEIWQKIRPLLWLLTKAAFIFAIIYILFIAPHQ